MTIIKADVQAAERLLKKAIRRAVAQVKEGQDPRWTLAEAERGAELLLAGERP